jgi:hypothetical protein
VSGIRKAKWLLHINGFRHEDINEADPATEADRVAAGHSFALSYDNCEAYKLQLMAANIHKADQSFSGWVIRPVLQGAIKPTDQTDGRWRDDRHFHAWFMPPTEYYLQPNELSLIHISYNADGWVKAT